MHAPAPPLIPQDMLLLAYRSGIFPMSDSRDDPEIFWVEPRARAIFPLNEFRPSKSLRKVVRQDRYTVTCNAAFNDVMEACAEPRADHSGSWISHRIAASYAALHDNGHAHSIECWDEGKLVGGLYGVSFDRVFCGESMFSRADNASKTALVWLVAILKHAGFEVLDCQFMTDHLATLGAVEIPQSEYCQRIAAAAQPARQTLEEAYVSLVAGTSAVGSGGASAAGADGFGVTGSGAISPGKLIAQSFTHTS